jgi:hypothetical protein
MWTACLASRFIETPLHRKLNGKQGTELADVIVDKITQAVDKVAFK